ncbi:unnamed protein product [Pedinophyceae sp. YPF-701]|nr:unnamed protein product [Pedinophyceae sp. YPF-701]
MLARARSSGAAGTERGGARDGEFEDGSGISGDSITQDILADMVQVQIGKVRINEAADEEEQRLKELAEQTKLEIEEAHKQRESEAEQRWEEAMSSIDRLSAEADADLRAWREESRAAAEQDAEFERKMRRELSQYQFFQSLYDPAGSILGGDKDRPGGNVDDLDQLSMEELRERAAEVQASMDEDLRSPTRSAYYAYLTLVLGGVCLWEVFGREETSWFHVGLYGLIGVFMSLQLIKENKHLNKNS